MLEVAENIHIFINFSGIRLGEIGTLTEAFITSASRGVLPVVMIDRFEIGNGRPGRITQLISNEFARSIEAHIKPI